MNLATEFDEVKRGRLIAEDNEGNGTWPPVLKVMSVSFHTSGNGRKDNTGYWASVSFRTPQGTIKECRTQRGP